MIRSLARYHPAMLGACLVAAGAVACTDNPPTAPTPQNAVFAKGAGGAGPKVSSTDPSSGARNTTLFVRVLGSGYSQGTRAVWALKGDTTFAVTRVKTNSTTFVSSTELVANITIQGDASLALYDVVAITAAGKKGIGIELFTVTAVAITDLGTIGGNTSTALALNTPSVGNRLLIVGHSQDHAGTQHAAYWYVDMATGAREAGALPAPAGEVSSWASGVNQSEAIVGSSAMGGFGRPVLWAPGGWSPTFLNMNGFPSAGARSINAAGQIVGSTQSLYESRGILWDGDILTDLSSLGGNITLAFDVNAAGVVVGISRYQPGYSNDRAFVWTKPGPMIQLPDAGHQSFAMAINDAGVIVGWVWSPTNGTRAVRWLPPATIGGSYTMEDLGLFNSFAYDINNAGEIVGQYQPGSDIQGFYWIDGRTKNLPGLKLPAGAGARAINDNGDIIGWSWTNAQNMYLRAVLWTHVR